MALDLSKSLSFRNHIYWIIIKLYDNVFGYNILPKLVNQLIASSIQIIQIDIRHLVSYYMPISLVYYYMGVFCDIWTLLLLLGLSAEVFRLSILFKHLGLLKWIAQTNNLNISLFKICMMDWFMIWFKRVSTKQCVNDKNIIPPINRHVETSSHYFDSI